jgi:hypothetical protein
MKPLPPPPSVPPKALELLETLHAWRMGKIDAEELARRMVKPVKDRNGKGGQ